MKLYPLKFYPILKERIWGGEKLKTFLNKQTALPNIGESWEISDVQENTSVVSAGDLKGKTLKELIAIYKETLVGNKVYRQFGNNFPLLIKFIDAKQDLSVQLHPNDTLAKARHHSFGKTEMWYIMQAEKEAEIIVDFKKGTTQETYLQNLNQNTLPNILNFERVKAGDTFFIEVGRVHAIGKGILLAEIQQTSDITYRIYDWDRVDAAGNSRELHTDLAIDAIDFSMPDNYKVAYSKHQNTSNPMVTCPYFTTQYLPVTALLHKENTFDSFLIYMCVEGCVNFIFEGTKTKVKTGETILLPAALKQFEIVPEHASKLLEIYIP